MEREIKLEGRWWLPENPNKAEKGSLSISPDEGIILEINWEIDIDLLDLDKDRRTELHDNALFGSNPEIIIGELFYETLSGKDITLYKCYKKDETLAQDICKTTYEVTYAFRGFCFLKPQDIEFSTITIDFTGLHDWVRITVFEDTYDHVKKKRVLEYKTRKEIPLVKTEEYEILIYFSVKSPLISTRAFVRKELTYTQETTFQLYFFEKKNFDYCLRMVYHLRDFLNLMIFKPVGLISMKATLETPQQFTPFKFGEIFITSLYSAYPSKSLRIYEILLPYEYIEDRITGLLQNWLCKADDLRPICDFYYDSFRNPDIMKESIFLSLVIAFESYLNNLAPMESVDAQKNEFIRKREEIIRKCPAYREIIKKRFYVEATLKEKLRELFKKMKPMCEKIIPEPEWDDFLSKVINTRNYLTHFSKKNKNFIVSGSELIKIIHQLRLLLNVCLLQELGLELNYIEKLMNESLQFKIQLKKIDLIAQGKLTKI